MGMDNMTAHIAKNFTANKTYCGRRVCQVPRDELVFQRTAFARGLEQHAALPCDRCVEREPFMDLVEVL